MVVPVGLYRTGDRLHTVLRGYKDAPAVAARRHFSSRLGTYLSAFMEAHGTCVAEAAGSTWDGVAVVPSSRRTRPRRLSAPRPEHPLESVVRAVPPLAGVMRIGMEPGPGSADHLVPDPGAFEVSGEARGRRVLLVDDAWVTGARMRSAAAALGAAGAEVVAMVVAGRAVGAVDSRAGPGVARWWRWAEARDRDRARRSAPCCLAQCTHHQGGGGPSG